MKKIISFILLLCMVLSVAACADNGSTMPESTTPEITLQEVYEAGKDYAALLGDHENVYILATSNGAVIREEYLAKDCYYSFYDAKYVNLGVDFTDYITEHAQYSYFNNTYARVATLAQSGLIDLKAHLDMIKTGSFISSMMLGGTSAITEKDGSIIVTCIADAKDIAVMGEGIVSCEESYTLDAKNREMTAVKTVCTYEDGTIEETITTITRDVEIPEGMKPFLAYEQETENLRTVTIISNPGTENEKTESTH